MYSILSAKLRKLNKYEAGGSNCFFIIIKYYITFPYIIKQILMTFKVLAFFETATKNVLKNIPIIFKVD
jgi:hypothetical protein